MKLTKITVSSLAILTGFALGSTTVLAEDKTTPAKVVLTSGTEEPGGPLSISSVVPNFDFGTISLGSSKTSNIVLNGGEKASMQVTDFRGTGAGWTLKAKISELRGLEKTTNILKAVISIPKGKITTSADGDISMPAEAEALTLNSSAGPVMKAARQKGMGTWTNDFNGLGKSVSITIPDNAYVDSYTGTITWSLEDAP